MLFSTMIPEEQYRLDRGRTVRTSPLVVEVFNHGRQSVEPLFLLHANIIKSRIHGLTYCMYVRSLFFSLIILICCVMCFLYCYIFVPKLLNMCCVCNIFHFIFKIANFEKFQFYINLSIVHSLMYPLLNFFKCYVSCLKYFHLYLFDLIIS